ncbi:hypothetical protein [Streptomyces scopuliridis]
MRAASAQHPLQEVAPEPGHHGDIQLMQYIRGRPVMSMNTLI